MKLSAYFFIAPHESYNDLAIHLAEGLLEIGVSVFCNRNFWELEPNSSKYLFKHDRDIQPTDCDMIVLSTLWFHYVNYKTFKIVGKEMPAGIMNKKRRHRLVLLDGQDGYYTVSRRAIFRDFDLVFRAHMNKRTFNPQNYRPWVLGFGKRVIRATNNTISFKEKKPTIVNNFGFTHQFPHGVRNYAQKFLKPVSAMVTIDTRKTPRTERPNAAWDYLMWKQTERKHNPSYYQQLLESQCVACFCGEFVPGLPYDPTCILAGGGKARLRKWLFTFLSKILLSQKRIIQWDSWRFWECLLSKSVAIHVDLEKYGVTLPIMPKNWEHYVGIDFDNLKNCLDKFISLGESGLREIAESGNSWAHKNYSPSVSAKRVLRQVGLLV